MHTKVIHQYEAQLEFITFFSDADGGSKSWSGQEYGLKGLGRLACLPQLE